MHMSEKKELVPVLRFPEFKDGGEWCRYKLSEVLVKNSTRNKELKYTLIQSVSNKYGFINQDEYFDNRIIASKDTSNYYIIKKGFFAYNPSRIDVGSLAYKQDDEISIISPLYVSFKIKNKKICDLFLYSYFLTENFKKQMIFEGGVRNTLPYENLSQIEMQAPSLPEQQKMIACLSSIDELMTAESKKLELLKRHKNGLMQNLFPQEGEKVPKVRFPEFRDIGEWEEKKMAALYDFITTNSLTREDLNYDSGKIKNIHYGDIHTKFKTLFDIAKENVPFINQNVMISKIKEKNFCKKGDIIFADTSENIDDVGKCTEIINLNGEKLVSGLHTLLARQKKQKLVIGFGGYLFKSDYIRKQIQQEAQGVKVLGISETRISNIQILFPGDQAEQQHITDCLSSLDEFITLQTKKVEQLKLHKKGLMQGLFPKIKE